MLRSLVAALTLASLILVAGACGEGADPTATPASSGTIEGVVKDADGVYRFPAIPLATFSVAVHFGQGHRIALQSVVVRSGEASKLDFRLPALP